MKKIIGFFMILLLGFFFLIPTKVFAFFQTYTAVEWYNHIIEFDKGYAYGGILYYPGDEEFSIMILKEPSGDILNDFVIYDGSEDLIYFEPQLHDVILHWISNDFYDDYYELVSADPPYDDFVPALENTIGLTNYSGYLYWNFEEQYWQIEYYHSPGSFEDEEFTFYYSFTESTESGNYIVRISFIYPLFVFDGIEIPIEIDIANGPEDGVTIESISFYDQQFDVYVTHNVNDTVNFFVDSNYVTDKISLTFLEYTFRGSSKTKNITIDLPVVFYSSEIDYYKSLVENLKEEIQELQNALDSEFDRGFDEGYDVGYEEGNIDGFDEGYQKGILLNNEEAYQEGFRDGEKSKLAEKNEAFYKGIEKWLVPAIITVIALGGFVTIAARKRREE